MAKQLVLLAMKPLFHENKGFTLVEMMLVLFILSILIGLSRLSIRIVEFESFENEVLTTQLKSMATSSKNIVEHTNQSNVSILSFNEWGNINMAQTIEGKETYVFQLGAGRYVKK